MAARGITRVTLFKVPKEADQKTFLDFYGKMKSKALKVSPVGTAGDRQEC